MKHKPKSKTDTETNPTSDENIGKEKEKMILPIVPITGKEKYPSQSAGMLGSAKRT